ncbi:MAG: UDP-N-acetylglucosamine--N-acetylmuramyl-(pentapeptide) pyrophosphoryl-undecaprenol N-acetylglucosamine transferase [Phycisphaeraceae bacterium]
MPTVLFAGGGTGGHLFPAIAVAQRLPDTLTAHFACSNRAIDRRILDEANVPFTPLTVRPLPTRPWHAPTFAWQYLQSIRTALRLIDQHDVRAVISMGGFVSAPAVEAARRRNIPVLLVNLDAVPGVANRYLVRRCEHVFSVHPSPKLPPRTQPIAMPLRRESVADLDAAECRAAFGFAPDRPVLLVTGASQGAESINRLMVQLLERAAFRDAFADWSILHLAGHERDESLRDVYLAAGMHARVLAFTHQMGLAWGAAELAISRAGANSVAEVAANAVPAIFLPYPYHKDQHQKHNAAELVEAGGAITVDDAIDPATNADHLLPLLMELASDAARLGKMRDALRALAPADGAAQLVEHLQRLLAR